MKRALAYGGVVLGVVLIVAAVVMFIAAIWTVGPDSQRLAGTGFVTILVGAVCGFFGSMWLDFNEANR